MAVQLDEGKSTDEAHEYTYKTLKNEVNPGLFQTLCCTENIDKISLIAQEILSL